MNKGPRLVECHVSKAGKLAGKSAWENGCLGTACENQGKGAWLAVSVQR